MKTAEILVSTYRAADPQCMREIMAAVSECNRAGWRVQFDTYGNALLHQARNRALAQVDADFAVFIDDDMVPERTAILKLLELNAPVASAVCTTRGFPVRLCVRHYDFDRNTFHEMDQVAWDRPTTGPFGVGAAFLAVRRDVIGRLIDHYVTAQDWVLDNRLVHDRMCVRADRIDRERKRKEERRRALFEKDKYARVFSYPVQDDELECGEDIGFSTRLLQLGIEVTIDPTIRVGHKGDYVYSTSDYSPDAPVRHKKRVEQIDELAAEQELLSGLNRLAS